MKDRKLAARYARALLEALPDIASQDRADAFLGSLADVMREHAETRAFLLNPAHPNRAKKATLAAIARERGVSDRVARFLEVVVDHGRISSLPSIAELFHEQREEARGIVSATLTTPTPVSAEVAARAEAALTRLAGRKVSLKMQVDPTLIGGAVTRLGSTIYDGSVRTRLARLRRTMGEE